MRRNKGLLIIALIVFSTRLVAQTHEISGKVLASANLYGIHIINKTAHKFTITNDDGEFQIPVRLFDTIMVSGVQYKLHEFVVTDVIIQTKRVTVNLDDKVNELDQVVVGKILTGDLMSDIENSDVKRDINFYDVGIPGYTGPRMTITEQRIFEAKSGGGFIPLNPLINWISGRTKRLNKQLEREKLELAVQAVKSKYTVLLFNTNSLETIQQGEFFYFSADDPKFMELYRSGNELKMLQFLQIKIEAFRLQIDKD
ncbi:CarboxypepD_reg-like domain-containing protein [Formosa sp. Hel1_31_208]|uniref:carboxypeptidase-like regulatory domain-containing protein n=1 Tax=Formosa sp. Hel1_31_208 TaxID=1798225 RepID=UPI00087A1689|nr:carboxypeptidase-like regulatory domain-containing protein [Formosa sp. Hel1_31_208]SDR94188.1 CarboxypepD_reg-like domain-containing protein [Formosa sp. Hel1_31_208]